MTQYKTQYGTIFAVKEHNGAPAIMCRAEHSETWSLSSMIEPYTPGAWTDEELQTQLDSWAATKGWTPFEESPACLCETCTCTGCHEDCFGHCKGCGHPVDHCNSYQPEGKKGLRAEPASAEPPEIVDEGSGPEDGCPYLQPLENSRKYTCQCSICKEKFVSKETCNKSYRTCGWYLDKQEKDAAPPVADDGFPDWVQPMAAEFLQFDFVRALPAFAATELKNSDPVQHYQGGSIADHGLYDTGPKGIKFTILLSNRYLEKYYTWPDFVRRCKAAGLAPELLHQDKEDAPCNEEQPAPTGDAAATTDGSAAPEPSQAAETSTVSPVNSADVSSCPSAEPARQAPAALPLSAPDTAPTSLPAFDYAGLDDQTVAVLHLAESEIREARQAYISRLSAAVAAAHEAVVANCENGAGGRFIKPEGTFFAWCASVGLKKDAAYRLLQINALFNRATAVEQAVLENASPSLLYAAAKPSAPPELVQAVKDGDITTHKQYQEALAEIRARDAKINDLLEMSEAADRRADKAEQAAKDNARERDAALRRAAEAENRAAGAQKLADQRGDENTALKAQIRDLEARPVEVAVAQPGEEQIEAWRKEGEARAAAALRDSIRKADQAKADAQRQVNALQTELAAARPDADACQRTVDTLYETTENLRLLLRTQLRQAQLPPATYGTVVAHVLQAADALRDTVRSCAPAGYTLDDEEDDFL